ncbi:MAG TPA: uroporphyrinogen-III synthase [Pyrinomonadaceae bacterium]|nr:uroporphyrinogen-III synthase [Pyrinomonadaceae bacterium]
MTPPDSSSDRPLVGRTIVITRARKQADEFLRALEELGANVIVCPIIEITDPESYDRLDEALSDLYGYDWLIFTSVNGVDYFLRRFSSAGLDVTQLDEMRVCAIGEATATRLGEAQIHVDVVPAEFKAEGVFAALEQFSGGPEALRGLNFLIPRAAVARDYLPRALSAAGARVDVVPTYRTVLPDNLDRGKISAMLAGGADCIAFTSSSTVRNLAQLFDTPDLSQKLPGVVVACIGDITAQTAVEYGLQPRIQPQEFTVPALAQAIGEYFSTKSSK